MLLSEFEDYEVGDIVDSKWRIIQLAGKGAMGVVYRVSCISDDTEYALKHCRYLAKDYIKRFSREVRINAKIEHAHVIPIIDHNVDHSPPYFIMPIAVTSLHDEKEYLSSNEAEAIEAILQVCSGVQATHNAGAIHRDIKPSNCLRLDDRRIVISDLGLAKFTVRDTTILTHTNAIVGTLEYVAPEQRLADGSRKADERTDVYQLGKTFYELLTNQIPVLIDKEILPGNLSYIIRKATREDPSERYQTVGALIDAINMYQESRDPKRNIRIAFESVTLRITDGLRRNEYSRSDIDELVSLLVDASDISETSYNDIVDSIPKEILPVVAQIYPDQFIDIMSKYAANFSITFEQKAFSYAEKIALSFSVIMKTEARPDVKACSMYCILLSSVKMNRFSAMDVFNNLLRSVRDSEVAVAVATMLSENLSIYSRIADQIPPDELHPLIQVQREYAIKLE